MIDTAERANTTASGGAPSHQRFRQDTNTRERMILQHLPLVNQVLARLSLPTDSVVTRDDLAGHGVVGLIEAVDRFDPGQGVAFKTYAVPRIRGAMIDAARNLTPLTRTMRGKMSTARLIVDAFQKEHGRHPTVIELERLAGPVLAREAHWLAAAHNPPMSLSHHVVTLTDGEEVSLGEVIPDEQTSSPLDTALRTETVTAVRDRVQQLPARLRGVIVHLYWDNWTGKHVGETLGITESRVAQLRKHGLDKLRQDLRSYHTVEPEHYPKTTANAVPVRRELPARHEMISN